MARAKTVLTVEGRVDNKPRATVRIEENGMVVVRPYRSRKKYEMLLLDVARMVCDRVARLEAEQARRNKGLSDLNRKLSQAFFGR